MADLKAREILASLSGLKINDKTNNHTARIVFGNNRNPQDQFNYIDLSEDFPGYEFHPMNPSKAVINDPDTGSISGTDAYTDTDDVQAERLYSGYTTVGKSAYRGEDPSEGGYVYVEEGMYYDVALLDVESLHPTSIVAMNMFGPYTKNFKALLQARLHIKHGEYDEAKMLFGGKLAPYLENKDDAEALSYALKIAINSVYGLTSAKYENPFRDIRNVDNIVAKRGALFMIDLKHFVQERGFTVAHIKTDSIKIPNATPEIIEEVMAFGHRYGYNFDHEATYEKMCIVNKAVYVAKTKPGRKPAYWTATGKQFQRPYVFKKMFSHSPIEFQDLCETRSVETSLYLDYSADTPMYKSEDAAAPTFIGKVGSFCPMLPGSGGGTLLRIDKDGESFASATGAKGYLWMESERVRELDKLDDIDRSYFDKMVDEAYATIANYGDVETFLD